MELEITPLTLGRQRGAGGDARFLAEDRIFLEYDAQVRVLAQNLAHHRHRRLAVATAVIEELDQGDVAIGVAGDRRRGIADQFAAPRHEGLLGACLDRRFLALAHGLDRLEDDLGMIHDVIVNQSLDRLDLVRVQRVLGQNRRERGR